MKRIILALVFVILLTTGAFAYYMPTFDGQPLEIHSNKKFYGSQTGSVIIDLNIENMNFVEKDLYLNVAGLEPYDTSLIYIKIDGKDEASKVKPLKSDKPIKFKSFEKYQVQLRIDFDPQEIGLAKEFDIQLVDVFGNVIADLDPFLSGWDFRQEWTMNTDGISLGASITDDHAIPFSIIDSNNADFWAGVDSAGADVRFTDSANTEYDYHFEIFNSTTEDMIAWVEVTETFDSATDITGYMYYGNGLASDNQDETGTYGADYEAVYHMDTGGANLDESTANHSDATRNGNPASMNGVVGNAVTCDGSGDHYDTGWTFNGEGSVSASFWFQDITITQDDIIFGDYTGGSNFFQFTIETGGTDALYGNIRTTGTNASGVYTLGPGLTNWNHFILAWDGSQVDYYLNGVLDETDAGVGGTINPTGNYYICGRSTFYDSLEGNLDEFKLYDSDLTTDEAKLIYNSESSPWTFVTFGAEELNEVNPTFSDLNLFEFDDFTQNINLTISTDTNIVFDFNVSDDGALSDFLLYYQVTHPGDDTNCFLSVRTDYTCGWKTENISWDLVESSADGNHYQSENKDDHAFKHSAYNIDPEDFETKGTPILLNSGGVWLKTLITNVQHIDQGTDSNIFFNFSFSANFVGVAKNLELYDCNQDIADPSADSVNCNNLAFAPTNEKEKDGYYSVFRASNDSNQIGANNVTLNSDGNHYIYANCTNCSANNRWEIDAKDTNSNIDRTRNWVSTTGVANLVASAQTIDFHIHYQQLSEDHNFNWLVQVTDSEAVDFNSSIYSEVIEAVNIEPEVVRIDNPTLLSIVSGNIDINAFVIDPNNDDLNCDIILYDFNGGINSVLESEKVVVGNNCNTHFDTTSVVDGNYFLGIIIRETGTADFFSDDLNQDGFFFIDNTAPVITVVTPNGGETFINQASIQIDFNISDAYTPILIDMNYSSSNAQGTGTELLIDESIEGVNIICVGITCSFVWTLAGVPDGNYYILINATDGLYASFDVSDSDFNIATEGAVVGVADANYTQRYFRPGDRLTDSNVYVNSNTAFVLTEDEKQTALLWQIGTIILIIVVILIVVVVYKWKQKSL